MNSLDELQQIRIKELEGEVRELKKDRLALLRVNTMAGRIILDSIESLRIRVRELEAAALEGTK